MYICHKGNIKYASQLQVLNTFCVFTFSCSSMAARTFAELHIYMDQTGFPHLSGRACQCTVHLSCADKMKMITAGVWVMGEFPLTQQSIDGSFALRYTAAVLKLLSVRHHHTSSNRSIPAIERPVKSSKTLKVFAVSLLHVSLLL